MIRRPLVVDIVVAVLVAAVVLIIEPGVGVGAVLALLVLAFCGVTLLLDRRRGRRVPGARPRRP